MSAEPDDQTEEDALTDETCRGCGGEGEFECETCEGQGEIDGFACDECTGIGKVECEDCEPDADDMARAERAAGMEQ